MVMQELFKYNNLIRELVARDIKKKYRRSVLGILWSMLNPLLMMVVTAMIFSNLFRFDIKNFPLYLLCGQIIFTFYFESTNFAMSSILENSSLIKKVYIPKYLFPVSRVTSSCVNVLFTLPALFLIMLVTKENFSWACLSFIIPLVLMYFFCLGVGLILATVAVYFRDTMHLYGVFTTMLNYATPIFYPDSIVPPKYAWLLHFNPLYYFLKAFRQSIYEGVFPDLKLLLFCFILAVVFLGLGAFVFKRYNNNFILYV